MTTAEQQQPQHQFPHPTGSNAYGHAQDPEPHGHQPPHAPLSPLGPESPPPEHEDFVTDTESMRSDYDEDFMDSYSLSSSILDYQYENGRRYASFRSGNYMMPNDEEEQERLDLTHHM
ncbi:uncharacterized protein BO66DRAFT_8761 [Aspergillus aculeatinus CBS 121060]|uniref:Uncharacterized protein n=1 Tax=Aspergillus aculeatinus CBS 121060 TaxID=1448322 RepID=A0ACD1HPE5_9EURO|nr:hypothetical protein BO66DRAFT_8761 [Aspergillus aculeatinus CBS 121060]RAH75483.1 hypothetical protein BO66DRAFT_8761 [Aspergillus aculeatinus CBS 121060]